MESVGGGPPRERLGDARDLASTLRAFLFSVATRQGEGASGSDAEPTSLAAGAGEALDLDVLG
ncbi:MAG: hypothetical protein K0S65_5262 [Labilithrix sp.]|nr:hypothetical protein [Labilithrix sp.]